MLHGNYSVLCKLPVRFLAGSTVSVEGQVRSNWNRSGQNRNKIYVSDQTAVDKLAAIPTGYYPPYTWFAPQIRGQIGCTGDRSSGIGGIAPLNLAAGLNAEAVIEGVGGFDNAAMGLIMSAVASMGGTCTFTSALGGTISAVAALSGAGTITAPLGAIVGAMATLAGIGGVCCSNLRADAFMSADIAPATTVAADVIANAVWAATAAGMDSGSMGEAVLASGGGLVPPTPEEVANAVWQHLTEGTYTAEEVLRLITAAMAGKVTGADSSTIRFRDLADTKDRITAQVDDKGNRTALSYDVL